VAWIESHQALGQHPKTIALADLLHVSLPTAVGHLQYFWWWALDFAPTGQIRTTPAVIARACLWRGNTDRFWQGLIMAGFMDVNEDVVTIHDWLDYAGRLVERRAANAERMRTARAKHVHRTSGTRAGATVPDPTGPYRTGPDLPPGAPPNDEMHVQRTNGNGTPSCCTKFATTGREHLATCPTRVSA